MTTETQSVALTLPDPEEATVQRIVPQGFATHYFAVAVDRASWADLDEAESRIRRWDGIIEGFRADTLELRKAWRLLEVRRGILLGESQQGRRTDKETDHELLPSAEEVAEIPPATASRYRKFARYADVVYRIVEEATDPSQVSQAAIERAVDEHRKNEVGPDSPRARKTEEAAAPESDTKDQSPDEHEAFDLTAELERAEKEIAEKDALIDTLSASDAGAENRKLHAMLAQERARKEQEQTRANEAAKQATGAERLLKNIRTELKVASNFQILDAIRDLKERAG